MDCDARRQILIRDLDGSFTGAVGGSVISKAEYEWDGDKRYGLGMLYVFILHVKSKQIWFSSPVYGDIFLY